MSDVGAAIVAVVVLVAVIGASVALARTVRRRNQGIDTGSPRRMDPFTVGEPWRRHVAAAQAAQRRYRTLVQTMTAGPLRARMAEIGMQVDKGVHECWEIARRGHQLDAAIRDLNPADLQTRLDKATSDSREALSLRAQLGSVGRIRTARDDADERLRGLQTRLGELVSNAAEVTNGVDGVDGGATDDSATPTAAGDLGTAVDDVVTQLEALRLAIREVNEPAIGFDGGTASSAG